MIAQLRTMENNYIKSFSEMYEDDKICRFWDDRLPDMYGHNFTFIKRGLDSEEIQSFILGEIKERQKMGRSFLRIECDESLDEEIINRLPITPEVSKYDYMYIESEQFRNLEGRLDCLIKEAKDQQTMNDGIELDILANKKGMGDDFARKRIDRKAEVYRQPQVNLNLFVCYHNNLPIGNCELMVNEEVAKIEDFDILENYQRQGFGTSVLRYLLEHTAGAKVKLAYLITDSEDTAKEMYKKCGFKKAGEKIELFFKLK